MWCWIGAAWAGTVEVGANGSLADALLEPGVTEIVLLDGYDPTAEDYGGAEFLFVTDSLTLRSSSSDARQRLPRLSLAASSGVVTLKDVSVDGTLNDGTLFVQFGEVRLENVEFIGDDFPSGVQIYGGVLTLESCQFRSFGSGIPGVYAYGYEGYDSVLEVTVSDSRFDSMSGGAVYIEVPEGVTKPAALRVEDSVFDGCKAANGGSVLARRVDEVRFERSEVLGATATSAGGALNLYDSPGAIEDSTFSMSTAHPTNGGFLHLRRDQLEEMRVDVTGSDFGGGSALVSGGAIQSWGVDLRVDDTVFTSCAATGGGAINVQEGRLELTNSVLTSNAAEAGGAIRAQDAGDVWIANTMFCNNQVADGFGGGADFDGDAEVLILENNVLQSSLAPQGAGLLVQGEGRLGLYDNTVVQQAEDSGWVSCDSCVADVVNNLFSEISTQVVVVAEASGRHNLWFEVAASGEGFPSADGAVEADPQFVDDYEPGDCASLPELKGSSPALGAGDRPTRPGGEDIGAMVATWGEPWTWDADTPIDTGDEDTGPDSAPPSDSGDSAAEADTGIDEEPVQRWLSGGCSLGGSGALVLLLGIFLRRRR